MIHHLSLPVTNLEHSAAFYEAALAPLGYKRTVDEDSVVGWGFIDNGDIFSIRHRPNEPIMTGDGFHLAFIGRSHEAIDQFYHAALALAALTTVVPGSTLNTAQTTMATAWKPSSPRTITGSGDACRELASYQYHPTVALMLDWSQCSVVERIPGKVSGAWLFKDSRVPVTALFENIESGATVEEFIKWFPGVSREQVETVLEHAQRSLIEA